MNSDSENGKCSGEFVLRLFRITFIIIIMELEVK